MAAVSVGCYAKSIRRLIVFATRKSDLAQIRKSFGEQQICVAMLDIIEDPNINHPHVIFAEKKGAPRFTRKKFAPCMRIACEKQEIGEAP